MKKKRLKNLVLEAVKHPADAQEVPAALDVDPQETQQDATGREIYQEATDLVSEAAGTIDHPMSAMKGADQGTVATEKAPPALTKEKAPIVEMLMVVVKQKTKVVRRAPGIEVAPEKEVREGGQAAKSHQLIIEKISKHRRLAKILKNRKRSSLMEATIRL